MYVADSVRALDVLGPRLVQIYGQGESPMTITVLTAPSIMDDHEAASLERLGSVGRAQVGVEVQCLAKLATRSHRARSAKSASVATR